ncbi:MAG: phosphotransferase family protein [Acidimicrobiales bacterium]
MNVETKRWVEEVSGCRVVASAALVGGVSSAVHRCSLDDGREVVVRHIDDQAWLDREPYLIRAEATALGLAAADGLPVPDHLASDPVAGRLLMSLLPGAPAIGVEHLEASLDRFAALAASIASVELTTGHDLPVWRPWRPSVLDPPSWGSQQLWNRAIAAYRSRSATGAAGTSVLLHRDLHPLNVLWHGRRLTGIVDWVNACTGHPHAELYHARFNLTVLGDLELADEFLARYVAITERSEPYDPRWDLETPISLLGSQPSGTAWRAFGRADLTDAEIWSSIERFVAAALADM